MMTLIFNAKYVYICTKEEFTSLVAFGCLPIVQDRLLELDTPNFSASVLERFSSLPIFRGDESYLFLALDVFEENVLVRHVKSVHPLSEAAKYSLEGKFSRIIFSSPIDSELYDQIELEHAIRDRYHGADVFCQLSDVYFEKPDWFNSSALELGITKRFHNVRSSDFRDHLLVHLLAYSRYAAYPNTDLGFFFEFGELYVDSSKTTKQFTDVSLYKKLSELHSELGPTDILKLLSELDSFSFLDNIRTHTKQEDGTELFVVGVLFLKFVSELRERDNIKGSDTGQVIGKLRNSKWSKELHFAIYLTGFSLGFDHLSESYYSKFKHYIPLLGGEYLASTPLEDTSTTDNIQVVETVSSNEPNEAKKIETDKSSDLENESKKSISLEEGDKKGIELTDLNSTDQVKDEPSETKSSDTSIAVESQVEDRKSERSTDTNSDTRPNSELVEETDNSSAGSETEPQALSDDQSNEKINAKNENEGLKDGSSEPELIDGDNSNPTESSVDAEDTSEAIVTPKKKRQKTQNAKVKDIDKSQTEKQEISEEAQSQSHILEVEKKAEVLGPSKMKKDDSIVSEESNKSKPKSKVSKSKRKNSSPEGKGQKKNNQGEKQGDLFKNAK